MIQRDNILDSISKIPRTRKEIAEMTGSTDSYIGTVLSMSQNVGHLDSHNVCFERGKRYHHTGGFTSSPDTHYAAYGWLLGDTVGIGNIYNILENVDLKTSKKIDKFTRELFRKDFETRYCHYRTDMYDFVQTTLQRNKPKIEKFITRDLELDLEALKRKSF